MITLFNEREDQLLRRLFAYSVESPMHLANADLWISGTEPAPDEDPVAQLAPRGSLLELLSRLRVVPRVRDGATDLADRFAAVLWVGYHYGFFASVERAGLPTAEEPLDIGDLYPGLREAAWQYCSLESATTSFRQEAQLWQLRDRKPLVKQTVELLEEALRHSYRQGYRTGALITDGLRGGSAAQLGHGLDQPHGMPDDALQNRVAAQWLGELVTKDWHSEILRRQTPIFWSTLEAAVSGLRPGLPRAAEGWKAAGDGYREDALVAIAQAGLVAGLTLHLARLHNHVPPIGLVHSTYRISHGLGLIARQWQMWHPAPARAVRIRQQGDLLTAPTFATAAVLGIMLAEALDGAFPPETTPPGN